MSATERLVYDMPKANGELLMWRNGQVFWGGGVLSGIRGRGVPPGSPNPDSISDQNMPCHESDACAVTLKKFDLTGKFFSNLSTREVIDLYRVIIAIRAEISQKANSPFLKLDL